MRLVQTRDVRNWWTIETDFLFFFVFSYLLTFFFLKFSFSSDGKKPGKKNLIFLDFNLNTKIVLWEIKTI